jgi:hypothetical protein
MDEFMTAANESATFRVLAAEVHEEIQIRKTCDE